MTTSAGARTQARASYIAISTYVRRQLHTRACVQSRYTHSDFANQPFTGTYEPGQPTTGPLANIPLIGRVGPTPKALKQHLDQFVVGQERAKKTMSTAVYNHYQRILELHRREEEEQQLLHQKLRRERGRPHPLEDEFPGHHDSIPLSTSPEAHCKKNVCNSSPLTLEKSNILLLGPSGVGKTLMAKTLARVLEVPFSMSDCTSFTQAGYIGEDVQVCVERLLAAADYDVEAAEYGVIVLDEVDKIAAQKTAQGRDVGGEGVQQALLKIIEGTTIQIQTKPGTGAAIRGTNGLDPNSTNPMFGGKYASSSSNGSTNSNSMSSLRNEIFNVRTDNILFIFTGAFIGLHKHVISRVQKGSIGFGSPIKSVGSLGPKDKDEMLPLQSNSEEGKLFEKHVPFFHEQIPGSQVAEYNPLDLVEPVDLQAYGMIPELVGRIPVTTALAPLDEDALMRVLTEPKNSLIKQYEELFQLSGIELRFTSESLREIAKTALGMSTGARALRTCVERLLSEAMFEAPGSSVKYILVTGSVARRKQAPIYFSRGQQHKFQSLIAEEEEASSSYGRKDGKFRDDDKSSVKNFEEYRARSTAAGYI